MKTSLRIASATVAVSLCASLTLSAAFPPLALKPINVGQIHSPTTITFAPDGSGRLFVVDQIGKIYIIQNGLQLPTPFLNIANPANAAGDSGPGPVLPLGNAYDERGLLGMAFHPGFANPLSPGYRKFYLNYIKAYAAGTDPGPPGAGDPVNCVTVISEFEVSPSDPNVALPGSERRVLAFTQPQFNHNGGAVEFGPDGMLYIGSGDGGSANDNNAGHTGGAASPRPTNNLGNALDRTRYLGKILRIDPLDPDGAGPFTYSIPSDNPFFNDPTPGLKKEIYAFGLRNPWKFSFDMRPGGTSRLFCGDVGQGRIEEINLIEPGGNYGWRFREGFESPSFSSGAATNPMLDPGLGPYLPPIAVYAHPGATNTTPPNLPQLGLSVTGGYVYRGAAIPALQGKYVFGDYGATSGVTNGRLMGLEETAPYSGVFDLTQAVPLVNSANPIPTQRILCLGEDAAGEIYLGVKTKGPVTELDGGFPSGSIFKLVAPSNVPLSPIEADHDNTIFSDGEPTVDNGRSNGNGSYLFAGFAAPNDYESRRALVSFDLSSVPVGAQITTAAVHLMCDKQANSNPVPGAFRLHRLDAQWGEGASNSDAAQPGLGEPATAGDTTWRLRLVSAAGPPPTGTAWTTPGGDFAAAASATTTVGNPSVNPYVWSSAQVAADVRAWLAAPATNFGWMLIGPEGAGVGATAKRFLSRENQLNPAGRPKLYLSYGAAPAATHFETWLATYYPSAPVVGKYVDPSGDTDGDTLFNLIEYAAGFSPLAANPAPNTAVTVTTALVGVNTVATITFRRDPRATDLHYYLEVSPDLAAWTIIAQSLAGGTPTGAGYQSEAPIAGSEPVRRVTATQTLPTPSPLFVRLRLTQQ
jgi:glucose/arabinose dehydrogenase